MHLLKPTERLPPSRMLLLQAYDACHPRQGWRQWQDNRPVQSSCPLDLAWPDEPLSPAVRMAATVDIYRILSGDMRGSDVALSTEATLVAKKRDHANRTPR